MDVDDFWTFIELSHRAGAKPRDREAFLAHRLSRIPRSHLLDFVQHLSATREPANTYRLRRAADILATVPAVQRLASLPRPWQDDDYPTWESLEYVACEVGDRRADIDGDIRDVVTEERAVTLRSDPNPSDVDRARMDTEAVALRYPHLWALFGEHWTE